MTLLDAMLYICIWNPSQCILSKIKKKEKIFVLHGWKNKKKRKFFLDKTVLQLPLHPTLNRVVVFQASHAGLRSCDWDLHSLTAKPFQTDHSLGWSASPQVAFSPIPSLFPSPSFTLGCAPRHCPPLWAQHPTQTLYWKGDIDIGLYAVK